MKEKRRYKITSFLYLDVLQDSDSPDLTVGELEKTLTTELKESTDKIHVDSVTSFSYSQKIHT